MKEKIKKILSAIRGNQVKKERLTLLGYGSACSIAFLVSGDWRVGSYILVFTLCALLQMWIYGGDIDILEWLRRLRKRGGRWEGR